MTLSVGWRVVLALLLGTGAAAVVVRGAIAAPEARPGAGGDALGDDSAWLGAEARRVIEYYRGLGFRIDRELEVRLPDAKACNGSLDFNGCAQPWTEPAIIWVNNHVRRRRVASVLLHELTHVWFYEEEARGGTRTKWNRQPHWACDFVAHVLYCELNGLPRSQRRNRVCQPPWSKASTRRPRFPPHARWYKSLKGDLKERAAALRRRVLSLRR